MNRKAIKAAIFSLVAGVQFDVGNGLQSFATASPKLKHWNDVKKPDQPAFCLSQGPQTAMPPPVPGAPQVWHLDYTGYIYVNSQDQTDPADVLNPILDVIEAAFSSDIGLPQTLGGLVQWARIDGKIDTFEGTLGDQEVALIPIRARVAA
jgi:hypothetical protein